jgi:hypothetical protein
VSPAPDTSAFALREVHVCKHCTAEMTRLQEENGRLTAEVEKLTRAVQRESFHWDTRATHSGRYGN